ncbi:ABC transporter substrate-binding protein [Simiduia agarivorans]|uniref:Leucine-binding protein domain-containing protein n=1 Tax=Simiduia agarivorans (strain DSM 21679 / JCM 13881 / BCRC 17597 / SA1) TaxID=1117647 RepID=K4KJN3_SIMAS|nr:ABC transporter substrate-binding protein [Simiduia agarivorans]AFU98435.1 hypothetical protein M5M_06200 [Simiduia agarivorans SA1 = DSM 21679]
MVWLFARGSAARARKVRCLLAIFLLGPWAVAWASESPAPIHIYLDADRTHNQASAIAIERGLQVALDEADNQVQGRPVALVTTDHRGNSLRAKRNMEQAFNDPSTLLVMAGMHSPPLIKYRDYINEQQMLTLVPWAAGGPITRYSKGENWIFRLSVDDTKAGQRLAAYALTDKHCKHPHLLLERTPWGASNQKSLTAAFQGKLPIEPPTSWFNWEVSEESARIMLRSIVNSQADCLIFVGNARDGITIMNAAHSLAQWRTIPVISHWGITGADFSKRVPHATREALDLSFLQTCFSFNAPDLPARAQKVLNLASTRYPGIRSGKDIQAPAGFIHAYDLGRLLLTALNRISLGDDMPTNRAALRRALENLPTPVEGLVKTYQRPFAPFSHKAPDAHEALGLDDLCMARYTADNSIELLASP